MESIGSAPKLLQMIMGAAEATKWDYDDNDGYFIYASTSRGYNRAHISESLLTRIETGTDIETILNEIKYQPNPEAKIRKGTGTRSWRSRSK
jgi:hypothetical protein